MPKTAKSPKAAKTSKTTRSVKAKAPAKKTTRKPAAKRASAPESLHMTADNTPFLTIAITTQTIYWLIIATCVLGLGLWVINIQVKINEIYDSIDATSNTNLVVPRKTVDKPTQP